MAHVVLAEAPQQDPTIEAPASRHTRHALANASASSLQLGSPSFPIAGIPAFGLIMNGTWEEAAMRETTAFASAKEQQLTPTADAPRSSM